MGDMAAMAAVTGTAMAAVTGTAMGTDTGMDMGTDTGMGMGTDMDTDTDTGIGMAVVAGGTAGGMVTAVPAGCGPPLAGFGLATENGSKGGEIAGPLLMAIFA
jgi:hypothetical protein